MTTTQAPSITPFCDWVIAREYYDGPVAGIGLRARDQVIIFFRAVAWDKEQWNRVFATSPARKDTVARLQVALTKIETPKVPFWLPGPATNTTEVAAAWDLVLANASESREWCFIESHDLLEAANEGAVPSELVARVVQLVNQRSVADLAVEDSPLLPSFLDHLRGPAG